jgi:hypothetical protein
MWQSLYLLRGLQNLRFAGLEDYVFENFLHLYDKFEETRSLVDASRFYEIRYEDLVREPIAQAPSCLVEGERMETRQRHTWVAPSSAYPPLAASALCAPSEPLWTILVWDARPARLAVVRQLIVACGAHPRCNAEGAALPPGESTRECALAVVALEACPTPGDRGVEVIRSLKQKGVKVICYADGAPAWPLSVRCQLLVAGAFCYLTAP